MFPQSSFLYGKLASSGKSKMDEGSLHIKEPKGSGNFCPAQMSRDLRAQDP